MDRREFLRLIGVGAAATCAGVRGAAAATADDEFLDDLQRRGFRYFTEQSDPATGLVREASRADGAPMPPNIEPNASVAVTGMALAALCAAAERGWIDRPAAKSRAMTTLRALDRAAHERGWWYHWLNVSTGARYGAAGGGGISEISSVDSAFLLAGVLTVREYFRDDAALAAAATALYTRVDFPWMLAPNSLLFSHGWAPEGGFLASRWDEYAEETVLPLLAIGSPTHPVAPEAWYAWSRAQNHYGSYQFVGEDPLFTFQYSHAFVDYRGRAEHGGTGVDWFRNSQVATRAHRQFCLDLAHQFPGYQPDIWGITTSLSPHGYVSWGGPPRTGEIDGTVVPSAPGGSLMFCPDLCLPALRAMQARFGAKIYGRYGFADAFNPTTGWVSDTVLGLDLGITFLAAENLRTGNIWRWFMAAPEIQRAMRLAKLGRPG